MNITYCTKYPVQQTCAEKKWFLGTGRAGPDLCISPFNKREYESRGKWNWRRGDKGKRERVWRAVWESGKVLEQRLATDNKRETGFSKRRVKRDSAHFKEVVLVSLFIYAPLSKASGYLLSPTNGEKAWLLAPPLRAHTPGGP